MPVFEIRISSRNVDDDDDEEEKTTAKNRLCPICLPECNQTEAKEVNFSFENFLIYMLLRMKSF